MAQAQLTETVQLKISPRLKAALTAEAERRCSTVSDLIRQYALQLADAGEQRRSVS
ncbi:MAG: ribbon-helix-helix protein, CopG family [Acidimicrobiales bacterium]